MNLKRLEAYLDECEAPLARCTGTERAEWRDEARQHLIALMELHVELGASEEEALEAALRQFGEPGRLGKKLATAMHRTGSPSAGSHHRGIVAWTLAWDLGFAVIAITRLLWTPPDAGNGSWGPAATAWSMTGAAAICVAGHLLAKGMLGRAAGKHRVPLFLAITYVGYTLAALLLTGTLPVMTPTHWLATACSVVGTLGAGWLAASLAERRHKKV